MVSRKEDQIDFDKLEKELNAAVNADVRYWTENDAKLRAVHQKVATYDEFRDIVLASHLKPLEKTDKIGHSFKQQWNAVTGNKDQDCTGNKQDQDQMHTAAKLPGNGHEFAKLWRNKHKTMEQRYEFLLHVGAEHLGHIFKTEISFGLLGEILSALSSAYRQKDGKVVLSILNSLTLVNRFSLSLQFLDKTERETCQQLFDKLRKTAAEADDGLTDDAVLCVATLYDVKFT